MNKKFIYGSMICWEEATRVPQTTKAPKYKANAGKKVNHPMSLLNIYTTILSLTGSDVASLKLN